jgi:spore maturation protein SpmB
MKNRIGQRVVNTTKLAVPSALRTAWWMIRLTVLISFGVEVLRYLGVVAWTSDALSPVFEWVGLPGEASLAYITGFFGNIYSAIAVIASLQLDVRSLTILAVMALCSHNMLIETAVQKKTGSSFWRMMVMRTLSAVVLGFVLNLLMPASLADTRIVSGTPVHDLSILEQIRMWALNTGYLVVRMLLIIVSLSVVQRLMSEFGVIRWLSKLLRPLLYVFGLPGKTSFLWIVANFLGLAYGAAVMIEETEQGKISRRDADLLNHHIGVSHSNLEDLLLFFAIGGLFWWMLLPRLCWAIVLVWERRLEWWLRSPSVSVCSG